MSIILEVNKLAILPKLVFEAKEKFVNVLEPIPVASAGCVCSGMDVMFGRFLLAFSQTNKPCFEAGPSPALIWRVDRLWR